MDWQRWFDNGLSIGILVAIGVGVFYASRWLGKHFLVPIKNRILRFFDVLEAALKRMKKHDILAAAAMGRIQELVAAVQADIREVKELCLSQREQMEQPRRGQSRRDRPQSQSPSPPD